MLQKKKKEKTAHKATQTIRGTLPTMNAMQIQLVKNLATTQ
jgi:hypothetical protein